MWGWLMLAPIICYMIDLHQSCVIDVREKLVLYQGGTYTITNFCMCFCCFSRLNAHLCTITCSLCSYTIGRKSHAYNQHKITVVVCLHRMGILLFMEHLLRVK